MKKKIHSKLSPLQRSRLMKVVAILVVLALSWLLFAPEMGFITVQKERSRLEALRQQKQELEQQNAALQQEIDKIYSDIEYFERLAREKHGLLKKNEMLFDFGEEGSSE
ncbi:MAG: septum formation initiator family protein [Desulfocapsaceae bacterium]|nr:septum formation initiator family protein [Desulfocapsaceae bacterium]